MARGQVDFVIQTEKQRIENNNDDDKEQKGKANTKTMSFHFGLRPPPLREPYQRQQ